MSATKRAAVNQQPWPSRARQMRRPEPGDGRVLVRLEGSGLCGSLLPTWQCRERGRWVMAGYHPDGSSVAGGKLEPGPLDGHRSGPDELARAVEAMHRDGFLEAPIVP